MKFKETSFGKIPVLWKTSTVVDSTEVVTDYVANGSFASLAENVEYKTEKDSTVLIRLVDYNSGFKGNFVYINDHAYNFLAKSKLFGGEIIISNVGANVGTVFKCPYLPVQMSLGPNSIMVKFKENNDFYYHWLRSPFGQHMLKSIVTGSAQPKFNKTNFRTMEIPVPPINTQSKIAAILNSLDDKISLNQKINDNLEQQAQALFKVRFVDGAASKITCERPLAELCEVVTKGTTPTTLGKRFVDHGINFIKAESISDSHVLDPLKFAHIDDDTHAMLKRSIIRDKDIVFTIAGTLGRFALVDKSVLPANTNQAVAIIRANPNIVSPYYLYSFFIGNWHNEYYSKHVQQAVQANLSLTTIKSLPIPILSDKEMKAYLSIIIPIFEKINIHEQENKKLSELRDSLLPKLMSGEIDVSEIEI